MDTVFMKGRGFEEDFVKSAIKELLQAVDFLHTEVKAVHTGIQSPFPCPPLFLLFLVPTLNDID